MNLVKGRLFTKFWRAKMNTGRNTWAASTEMPKLYSPKQPFLLIHQNFVPPILPAIRYTILDASSGKIQPPVHWTRLED